MRAARMPSGDGARLTRERRGVGEHRAGAAEQPTVGATSALALLLAVTEVLGDDRRVLVGRRDGRVVRTEERDHRVTQLGKRHVEPPGLVALAHVASSLTARPDADHVHGTMADAVVAIAREIFGGKLPVARHQPLVDAADDLGAALAPVPGVEEQIEIELVAAEILQESRRRCIPRRPDRALVVLDLRDLDEAPARAVQLRAVRLPRVRHAHERAVGPVAPPVIGAHELDRVALVVAADLHAAMPARVEEHADLRRAVATEDDRLLAHRRDEVVARPRDLTLMAEEKPRPCKYSLQLLPVEILTHEDLPADDPPVDVDQAVETSGLQAIHQVLPRHGVSGNGLTIARWCKRGKGVRPRHRGVVNSGRPTSRVGFPWQPG